MGTNMKEYIQFASEIVENLKIFSGHHRQWYLEAIEKIKKRAEDSYLNVALIGDFSSGKSTFINGLIGQDILKTAWLATTAVPTHMYYQNRDKISIILEMVDGDCFYFETQDESQRFERRIEKKLPEDTKDLIAFLSTSNDFAEQIERMKLYTPADESMKKICIVDTPGVNPGAKGTESHVMATRKVLHEYADATIVLFKADQVYTSSFNRFLEENASHLMDEAVFVVTMMDLLEEEEQSEVIEFIKERLKQNFHLQNPIVYGCSAKYANKTELNDDSKEWKEKFDVLRKNIIQYIESNRVRIIQKQLDSLMKELSTELDKEISYNIELIQEQLKVLEEHNIDKLESELNSNFVIYKGYVNEAFLKIDPTAAYHGMFQSIRAKAQLGIQNCTKLDGTGRQTISGYMKEGFPEVVKEEQDRLSKQMGIAIEPIYKFQKEYYEKNTELFQKYNLALKQGNMSDVKLKENLSYSQEYTVGHIDGSGQVQDLVHAAGILAAIPIMIPLAVLDGLLGTGFAEMFGGAVSGVINLIGSFGVLKRNKERAISEMKKKTEAIELETMQEFVNQIQTQKNTIIDSMEKINKQFIAEYQKSYKIRLEQFQKERDQLNDEMNWNRETQEKLKQYMQVFEQKGIKYEFI